MSILIPTYARAAFVPAAVASALAQSHTRIEVVALDDASPDDTTAALAPFARDPRFRSVRHGRNLGIVRNWRHGIELARGEFFCLLHDDDTFEPDFVAALLAPLRADPDLVLAFCDHWVTDRAGNRQPAASDAASRRFGRDRLPGGPVADFPSAALLDHAVPVGATLFRAARVLPAMLDERAAGAIDSWLLYQLIRAGGDRAVYVPRRLMNYRVHGGGMSHGRARGGMAAGHVFRYERLLADPQPPFPAWRGALRDAWATEATTLGLDRAAAGRRREARRLLARVVRHRPRPRSLASLALACAGRPGTWLLNRLLAAT